MAEIDNFNEIKKHLDFQNDFERYIVHIIKRKKDQINLKNFRHNESQRLIKTYYINSVKYFEEKEPIIKDLCEQNNARAYFLPQVRNNRDCLINLGKLVFDNLDNPMIKFDSLIRTAICGLHKSRAKKWILDFDENTYQINNFSSALQLVKTLLIEQTNKTLEDVSKMIYILPTKNGKHIITSPFNLKKANELRPDFLFFEGYKKINKKSINGLLHKDGATLLYFKNLD